uniref:Elongator complex protein 5 n=1 Tax=Wuchereria bancrofti TaxID=6293 RepID=A0AAF5PXS2_WUCBA
MDDIRWKSLVVVKDTLQCSAEKIWASLMHDAIERNKGRVLVYLFTSCKNTLIKRYPFMLRCTLMEEIDSFANIFCKIITLLKNAEGTIVFLDSIDIISLGSSFDRVIVLLKGISQYATVIARMHDECISAQNWERLSSIAHITYALELRDLITPLCTIVSYKTDGKRIVGTVYIDNTFHLFFKQYKAQDMNKSAKRDGNLPVPKSSFNVGLQLKKSELEARDRVSLPYEAAQKEEELVRLRVRENRKIRAGGRIIYTPDEADDFDESDPDDDLEI